MRSLDDGTMTDTSHFLNRELSWLQFNQRVLDEARDKDIPLLERLRFLSITSSNLDEFFMVRVGGLKIQARKDSAVRDPAGMTADEQLKAIGQRTRQMIRDQYECFSSELEPGLEAAGVKRVAIGAYSPRQLARLDHVFDEEVHTVLTPIAVTSAVDAPFLVSQAHSLCVRLEADDEGKSRFAIIPLPKSLARFITLPAEGGYSYTLLEDLAELHADRFFVGQTVEECVPFRINRNADISLQEDQSPDLMTGMEQVLDARLEGEVVRLEIAERASQEMRAFLMALFDVEEQDLFLAPGPLDLASFSQLADLPGFGNLRYEPWPPQPSPVVDPKKSMFETLSQQDILLCHPYESFDPVVRLIEEAADDPDVIAIKQILYRTSRNSRIVAALTRAAEKGKSVTVIVELKARFDEARNIEWARRLEQASAQVLYGVKGLKTHAKICLVVRREPHGVQRYVHMGTGNYNESTARLYSDVTFMTANDLFGADATNFFNAVTGYSQPQAFQKLEAAPLTLRETILDLIEAETRRAQKGQAGQITAKVNSLVDCDIIEALYAASQAGVRVKLNVRGICCLKPGVKGLSDNIIVVSIIDRFLEHARILYFSHGGDPRVFISSADWMPRNLDRRIELLSPVEDAQSRSKLMLILDSYFLDTVKARVLHADGTYHRAEAAEGEAPFRCQEMLYQAAKDAVSLVEKSRNTTFEPHRAAETATS
jgi:polyphosphate kinase